MYEHDHESLFDGSNSVSFFDRAHENPSKEEKKRRRDRRARVQRALDRREGWTPAMHEEEQARLRAEVEQLLEARKDAA
ncbi:hypothetical protein SAMN05421666_1029 [Roseovarius nanhaiticus]|uniref:Uncharacterized protein n=1 Tax=Roseovarius nanhaiticus TaxID=573024 RepID=A0A1N7FGN3_9RHOB|nr:hypothetical protein [Roseovarius nanhaiticus]SEK54835.1 hypothetical protein SAMN05216208_1107 [Roseovarius nanhaiticus]SIR99519.1 hypothetical protein SAMN05421666_1029 [Roseovarius nanhaiticus]